MRGEPIAKIKKKQTVIRVPLDLLKVIEKRARQRYSSVNQELLTLAKIGLSNDKPEAKALEDADDIINVHNKKNGTNL